MKRKSLLAIGLCLFLMGTVSLSVRAAEANAAEEGWEGEKTEVSDEDTAVQQESVAINETNFPDANFRQYVLEYADANQDQMLSSEEIDEITEIDLRDGSITSVKGIEYFTELSTFICVNHPLEQLDMSKNKNLSYLGLSGTNLSVLNVSGCEMLESLDVYGNPLVDINVSGCSSLSYLAANDDKLERLDVSNCISLEALNLVLQQRHTEADKGVLKYLNVSGCTALKALKCENRDIETLYAIGCTNLETIYARDNKISDIKIEGCTKLRTLWCNYNNIEVLDVSSCIALQQLDCSHNQIQELNIGEQNQILKELNCSYNNLKELDINGFTALEELQMYDNQIKNLNISNCTSLVWVRTYNENVPQILEVVNARGCSALTKLECKGRMDVWDEDGNFVEAISGQLKEINVDGCTALQKLECSWNQLKELDLSSCTALQVLECGCNQLDILDLSSCTELQNLSCQDNQLRTLELKHNKMLNNIWCEGNPMPYLELSECERMENFDWIGHGTKIVIEDGGLNCEDYPQFDIERIVDKKNIEIKDGIITIQDASKSAGYNYRCKSDSDKFLWRVELSMGEKEPDAPIDKDFPFSDVSIIEGNWKYEAVKYVYNNNIMGGVGGSDQFQPDNPLTRAMFATVLYRMAGEPNVDFSEKFSDVEAGKWYSDAILWANQQGIVNGYSDGSYGINDNITREQIAKMLYLYGQSQGYDVSGVASLDSFTDKDSVSGWATGYMQWAVNAGMISGKPNGDDTFRLDPKGQATRAECAKMLMKFSEKYR